jgi:hypothetical protein
LKNEKVGANSDVGKGDVEFIRVEIELMASLEKWAEIYEFCHSILTRLFDVKSSTEKPDQTELASLSWANDWFVWENMLNSAEKLQKPE